MYRKRFLPTRSNLLQHRDKENAFCIRNKPFLFLSVSFAQGTFLPTRSAKAQHRDKENAFCIRNKPFLFFSGFFCAENVFRPLAVQKHSIGTKKTLSASEINRFYFLAVSFAQGTFLPTRSAKAQHRDKENDHIIKSFLLFVQREAFEVTFALSLLIKKGRTSVQPFWLGWPDSNQRMQQSKCCVLPLDDTPIFIEFKKSLQNLQTLWGG